MKYRIKQYGSFHILEYKVLCCWFEVNASGHEGAMLFPTAQAAREFVGPRHTIIE